MERSGIARKCSQRDPPIGSVQEAEQRGLDHLPLRRSADHQRRGPRHQPQPGVERTVDRAPVWRNWARKNTAANSDAMGKKIGGVAGREGAASGRGRIGIIGSPRAQLPRARRPTRSSTPAGERRDDLEAGPAGRGCRARGPTRSRVRPPVRARDRGTSMPASRTEALRHPARATSGISDQADRDVQPEDPLPVQTLGDRAADDAARSPTASPVTPKKIPSAVPRALGRERRAHQRQARASSRTPRRRPGRRARRSASRRRARARTRPTPRRSSPRPDGEAAAGGRTGRRAPARGHQQDGEAEVVGVDRPLELLDRRAEVEPDRASARSRRRACRAPPSTTRRRPARAPICLPSSKSCE